MDAPLFYGLSVHFDFKAGWGITLPLDLDVREGLSFFMRCGLHSAGDILIQPERGPQHAPDIARAEWR